jgi:sugar-specific transcriptional regulator TrmB
LVKEIISYGGNGDFMENNRLKSLKLLGLTEYEGSAYITLNYMISGTATEIGENANIPRSRIYDILRILVYKGFVEIKRGRPLTYSVVPPSEIFRLNKNKIIKSLEETEKELQMIYEDKLSKIRAPIWLVHNKDKIVKKELEIISRAKKSINMRIGFLFENEAEKLITKINDKIKKGIEVKIMISPIATVDNKKINVLKELEGINAEILKLDIPFSKIVVRDSIEMMKVITNVSGKNNILSTTSIGIWNQYEYLVKNFDESFNMIWERNK